MLQHTKNGYLLLICILTIGAIASVITASLILLGNSSQLTAYSVDESIRARNAAEACADYALLALHNDPSYTGNVTISTFTTNVSCTIHPIGGSGNWSRTLCTEAQVGSAVSRLEILIDTLLPRAEVSSWQEVPEISLCS